MPVSDRGVLWVAGVAARWVAVLVVVAAVLGLAGGDCLAADRDGLTKFSSRFYTIYSGLSKAETKIYATHMDLVFAEYKRRFRSFRTRNARPMPLYLFRTREDYVTFMAKQGIDATASGGMFFIRESAEGLATWTEGFSRSYVFSVLQHEGFHQFAHAYIGHHLPRWANEGLAVYFEQGVIAGNQMKLGMTDGDRVRPVQNALDENKAIDFDELLDMDGFEWNDNMQTNPYVGHLQYDQSWSIAHFLIHGEGGKYRKAFEKYLILVNKGRTSSKAFGDAFGTERTDGFRERWEEFARAMRPDPFTTAVGRMKFLARGLRRLQEREMDTPRDIGQLRESLREIEFRIVQESSGDKYELTSMDDETFEYERSNGSVGEFLLLEAAGGGQPPRLTAPGLKPVPTATWTRTADGELLVDMVYR